MSIADVLYFGKPKNNFIHLTYAEANFLLTPNEETKLLRGPKRCRLYPFGSKRQRSQRKNRPVLRQAKEVNATQLNSTQLNKELRTQVFDTS